MDVTLRSVCDPSRGVRLTATGEPELTETAMTWHVLVAGRASSGRRPSRCSR